MQREPVQITFDGETFELVERDFLDRKSGNSCSGCAFNDGETTNRCKDSRENGLPEFDCSEVVNHTKIWKPVKIVKGDPQTIKIDLTNPTLRAAVIEYQPQHAEDFNNVFKPYTPPVFEFIKQGEQLPGTKYDSDKIQYSLVPPYALEAVAKLLTLNLKKYKERNNWKKVPEAKQRYLDALYRHLEAHRKGEIFDSESLDPTTTHLSAVIANAMFLLEFELNPELKDS